MERNDQVDTQASIDLGSVMVETKGGAGVVDDTLHGLRISAALSDD